MANDTRTYDTGGYLKHKRPAGWGSLCPADLPETPQQLLDSGVSVDDCYYNVSGGYALCARSHSPGCWHGYPIPWTRLPAAAKNALIASGRLDPGEYRKALRRTSGTESSQP
jgi:hypothetical protein